MGLLRRYTFFIFSFVVLLLQVGLQVSGIVNMTLAIILWSIAGVLFFIGLIGFGFSVFHIGWRATFLGQQVTQKTVGRSTTPMRLWPKRHADEALLSMLRKQDILPPRSNGVTEAIIVPGPELYIEIHDYDFDLSGSTGYPLKRFDDDNSLWLRLGVTFRMTKTMLVETLYLILSGKSVEPYDWRQDSFAYYYYFEMPQSLKSGDIRTIQLVAFSKGKKWGSEQKEIRIDYPSK